MSFKKIPSASTERFRLLISDGLYSNSCAMLATQLNSLITDGHIDEYCVIRVNKHSYMRGKRVVIILEELDILRSGAQVGQKIGTPVRIQQDWTGSVNEKGKKEAMKQAHKSSEDNSSKSQPASKKIYVGRINKYLCFMQDKKIFVQELDILRSGAQVGQKIREFHIQKDGSVKDRKECMKQARKSSEDDSSESDSQAASNKKTKIEEIENENRRLKEARICNICMDNEIGVVFTPCGHLITCVNCAPLFKDCPVCRQYIKEKVKTYMS